MINTLNNVKKKTQTMMLNSIYILIVSALITVDLINCMKLLPLVYGLFYVLYLYTQLLTRLMFFGQSNIVFVLLEAPSTLLNLSCILNTPNERPFC